MLTVAVTTAEVDSLTALIMFSNRGDAVVDRWAGAEVAEADDGAEADDAEVTVTAAAGAGADDATVGSAVVFTDVAVLEVNASEKPVHDGLLSGLVEH